MADTKMTDLVKQIQQKQEEKKKEEAKFPKESVLYMYRPETQYRCDECVFAKEDSTKCAVFGAGESIKPYGSCGYFLHMNPDSKKAKEIPYLGLATKIESGYDENKTGFSCKRCEYFLVGKNDCKKVRKDSEGDTPGTIDPNACCNRFEADKKRGSMTDIQLTKLLENK